MAPPPPEPLEQPYRTPAARTRSRSTRLPPPGVVALVAAELAAAAVLIDRLLPPGSGAGFVGVILVPVAVVVAFAALVLEGPIVAAALRRWRRQAQWALEDRAESRALADPRAASPAPESTGVRIADDATEHAPADATPEQVEVSEARHNARRAQR